MPSPSVLRVVLAAAVSTALVSSRVEAHGYLIEPLSTDMNTTATATIDSSKLPAPYAGKKWNISPPANVKLFATAFAASGAKSIRPMMDKAAPGCGRSSVDGAPIDVSAMKSLKWGNDQEKKGFVTSHTGPCETWIDDVMVQQDINCVSKYPGYPATVPIDYSACKSAKCTLTFYWLALHEANWQVYKHCAPITNSGGGGGGVGGVVGNSTAGGGNAGGYADSAATPLPATPQPTVAPTPQPTGGAYAGGAAAPRPDAAGGNGGGAGNPMPCAGGNALNNGGGNNAGPTYAGKSPVQNNGGASSGYNRGNDGGNNNRSEMDNLYTFSALSSGGNNGKQTSSGGSGW